MANDPSAILFDALEREKWAYKKYKEAIDKFDDEDVKALFRFLAAEEKKHIQMIQDEIDEALWEY
ncbi:MAG: rubrerythrin family protein [Deltaproteobacteria bacterium]|nr:rubrerythrin family protein [Deltaproteobacteria bacterium]